MEQIDYIDREICPACGSSDLQLFLTVQDHRVSKAFFPIATCVPCGLRFTSRIPSKEQIGLFYKSDTYDSHRLDNNSLISRLYRLVRSWNITNKTLLLSNYTVSGKVVDYGCGLGHLVRHLKSNGFNAEGYEIDDDVRHRAKSDLNLNIYPLEDFQKTPNASVDVLMMWHVLEHVYDLKEDFQQIVDKVAPNGVLFIAVPNFRAYDAKYYGKAWEAYDVPRHLYHFDDQSIEGFCSSYGLSLESKIPMRFDSYYVSMASERNLKNGFVLRGVAVGLWSNLLGRRNGYSSHVYIFRK